MSPDSGYVPSLLPGFAATSTKLTLHLGVIDQPYRAASRGRGRKAPKVRAITTYDVAMILEAKYGLMAKYCEVHLADVVSALEKSLEGALENLVMGGPASNPWASGAQVIENGFKTFINSKEAERVGIPGTPTLTAKRGVNHRLKHPYSRRNPRRPSFRDTGLFVDSFKAWID